MLFANGDRAITGQLDVSVIERLKGDFIKDESLLKNEYVEEINFTKDTVTIIYDPIQVMEKENTIEPSTFIISRLEPIFDSYSEVN